MGKKEHCTYCLDFYRDKHGPHWGCSNRVVEVSGCANCQERHGHEIVKLKAELTSLQLDFDGERSRHETDLARLKEKSRLDLLNHKQEDKKATAELTIELNKLKEDNNGHLSKIGFLKNRRDRNQGDVVIAVSDARIIAHRTILAERSPVFQKFLGSSETSETETKEMPLMKLDYLASPVLEAIVDFCYSGEITFSELVPPHEVLKVASAFQLGYLSELTETELCRRLTVDSVPQMLTLAQEYSALRLQEEAGKLFKEHFDVLSSKVYRALQGPQNSTSGLRLIPKSSPELDIEQFPSNLNRVLDADEHIFFKPDSDKNFS